MAPGEEGISSGDDGAAATAVEKGRVPHKRDQGNGGDDDDDEEAGGMTTSNTSTTRTDNDYVKGGRGSTTRRSSKDDDVDDAGPRRDEASSNDDGDDEEQQPSKKLEGAALVQACYSWMMTDILMYIIVLNLGAELVDMIKVESFGFSILMSIVLKVVLEIVTCLEHVFKHYFCVHCAGRSYSRFGRYFWKFIGAATMWLLLVATKFVVVLIDEEIFQTVVKLGNYWAVLILCVVLTVMQKLARWAYHYLGRDHAWYKYLRCFRCCAAAYR